MGRVTLADATIALMNQAFDGHVCSECNEPAKRFKVAFRDTPQEHLIYYCHDHYPEEGMLTIPTDEQRSVRTFHHPRILEHQFSD